MTGRAASVLVILALALAGCGGTAAPAAPTPTPLPTAPPTPTPTPVPTDTPVPTAELHTLTGTFTLDQNDFIEKPAGDCRGTGGYSDIRVGMDVIVKDETGTIVGTGRTALADAGVRRCKFSFKVVGLPEARFYDLAVGRRGAPTYSLAQMTAMSWNVDLSIGP